MKYDFDVIIDRTNSDSLKYDFAVRRGKPDGILPLWVADMDFMTAPCVVEALMNKIRHGVFGYSESRQDYVDVLQKWFSVSFDWTIEPNWLVKTPGVVYSICTAIRALTSKGDSILIQQPVYYPFTESIQINDRKLVINQLVYTDGKYAIDFQDFEDKITQNDVRMFILCSPHNPVGRVWTKEELVRLGDICLKHGVTVVSDEIHADFVYPGYKHHVFAGLKPEFSEITITCTAPSKSFNLAGLHIANIFIASRNIRQRFRQEMAKSGLSQMNVMGFTACRAAYAYGREWLTELKAYIAGNLSFIKNYISEEISEIKLVEPQGTYLAWLDFYDLELDHSKLEDLIINKAGLWLDSGKMFGVGGESFQRINIACPRQILEKALVRLAKAINGST